MALKGARFVPTRRFETSRKRFFGGLALMISVLALFKASYFLMDKKNVRAEARVFFEVLSSRSFCKGNQLWVRRTHTMGFSPLFLGGSGACKSNMADKTSYRSYFPATAARFVQKKSPHQTVFKLTLSQKSIYVFRKDRLCKFIFLLSPSLDLINIISVRALEAMKVAGETLQGSRRSWPAAGSYLQPWAEVPMT